MAMRMVPAPAPAVLRAEELEILLNREEQLPLYRQIATALRRSILNGALPEGARLPSTRDLAKHLGVHRKTVVQAFGRLESLGLVEAGVGQGTFIKGPGANRNPVHPTEGSFDWSRIPASLTRRDDEIWDFVLRDPVPEGTIRLNGATADPENFPTETLREIFDEVLCENGTAALDYGPPAGFLPLREWLAHRLSRPGRLIDPSQVMIVNGSQQGLDVVARALLRPGDRVIVEEPSYSNGFRLFQAHGAEIAGVAMDGGGIRVDRLRRTLADAPAKLAYLMPIFQNPTGTVLDESRIEPILQATAEHDVPILEDHFDADLVYDGPLPTPIHEKDERGQVILLGTFSKILFPGLRLGWLVLPRGAIDTMVEAKQMADLSTGLLVQHAMNLYCRRGLLDEHLSRVRAINGRRLDVLLESLDAHMPDGVSWTRPRGGLTLWLTLPKGCDSLSLFQSARREGVEVSPGPLFFANGGGTENLRIGYLRESEERIVEGVCRLARAVEHEMNRGRGAASKPFV